MSTPRFFLAEMSAGRVRLSAEESAHARGARRLRPGDAVILFDGQGKEAAGRLVSAGRVVEVEVDEIHTQSWPGARLTIATAVPKGPRQDMLIEKCTELGVWAIWGVEFQRSVVKSSASRKGKWTRTAIEAAKQSGRAWLPHLEVPIPFKELQSRSAGFDLRYVGDPAAGELGRRDPSVPSGESILAVIGPEGGLTDAESAGLHEAGCQSVSWGRFVLRVETAAIAAAAILR